MIVVDASIIIELLLETPTGLLAASRFSQKSDSFCAPHLIDIEVVHVLRRCSHNRQIDELRAVQALEDFSNLPIDRFAHDHLLGRVWSLRHNLSAYDAVYVALAEALHATLLTCDRKMALASGHAARIEII